MSSVDPSKLETQTFDWGIIKWLVSPDQNPGAKLTFGEVILLPGQGHVRHNHPTAEEILYLLGILLEPANAGQPLKVVLTGPRSTADYFVHIRRFIEGTLGKKAADLLHVIVDDPAEVARFMVATMEEARDFRRNNSDSYNYNWLLRVPPAFQHPFEVTHESMRGLRLYRDQPAHELAADLRRAFSGIVTGNVKEYGIQAIERRGPYELHGDPSLMKLLDVRKIKSAQRACSLALAAHVALEIPVNAKLIRNHRVRMKDSSAFEICSQTL